MKMRPHYAIIALGGICLLSLVAWVGAPLQDSTDKVPIQDTVPGKKKSVGGTDLNPKALDKELKALERAKVELEKTTEIDFEKMQQQIEESLKKVDLDKIRLEAERAVKSIDIEKQVSEALSKIDFDKMQQAIEQSLKDSDSKGELEQARQEIQKAKLEVEQQLKNKEWKKEMEAEMKKVDMKPLEKEMEKAREEIQRVKADLKLEKINMTQELEKARIEIEKAQQQLKGYQEMLERMETDGLINLKEDYTIEFNEGTLLINGKKQPDTITSKYRKYFQKEKVTLKNKEGL